MEGYVGEIRMFSGIFAPGGWEFCNGQSLPINNETQELFALLGTNYGGDGHTKFSLPDLRGRFTMHWGPAADNKSTRTIGQTGGAETETLTIAQLPVHTHLNAASTAPANTSSPQSAFKAVYVDEAASPINVYATTPNTQMNGNALMIAGGNHDHENRPPFGCVSYIICMQGIVPTQVGID